MATLVPAHQALQASNCRILDRYSIELSNFARKMLVHVHEEPWPSHGSHGTRFTQLHVCSSFAEPSHPLIHTAERLIQAAAWPSRAMCARCMVC